MLGLHKQVLHIAANQGNAAQISIGAVSGIAELKPEYQRHARPGKMHSSECHRPVQELDAVLLTETLGEAICKFSFLLDSKYQQKRECNDNQCNKLIRGNHLDETVS